MSNRTKIVAIPKTTTTTTTFLPTSIAGCQLWLDGADATTKTFSGSNLTVWNDKSGNARHMNSLPPSTSAGASVYPTSGTSINGLATVNFIPQSGIKQSTTLGGVTNLFWVGRIAAPGANYNANFYFLLGHDDSYDWYDWCGRPYGDKFVDPTYTQSGIYNASPVSLFTPDANAIANATFSSVYMPSAPNVSILSVAGITGRTNYQGLCYDRIYHHGWCGDLAEVIIFSTALSTPNRQTIEAYLAQKWGLTSSLSAGHPGLTTTVYTITAAVPKQKISSIPKTIFVSFLPTSITGCALWMDGADPAGNGVVPANGATVSTWADKSGSGNNASGGVSPTYNSSQRAITFNGSSWLTTSYSCVPANETAFVVFQTTSSAVQANCFMIGPSAIGGRLIMSVNENDGFGLSFKIGAYGVANGSRLSQLQNQIYLGTTTVASTTSYVYLNGTQGPSSTLTYSGSGTTQIGTANSGSAIYIGYIYEIIIYNTALTNTQRQNVESYLAQKWGLTSNLAAGHPGLTTTVYGITTPAPTVRQKIGYIPFIPLAQYIQSFTYTGSNQTFTVPSRTTSITLYMWGAGGGGNTNYGGAGAMVQGVLSVTPGESLTVVVGQGGTIDGTTTFGGGGAGAGNMAFGGDPGIGYSGNGSPQNAGSGGGRSAIQRGGTDPTNDIVVAGGGGGGTYFSSDRGGSATFSGTANPGIGGLPGLGGTQSAGGAGGGTGQYGQGLGGSRGIGGNTYNTNIYNGGGGGGGGYYGGGGGGTNGGDGAGGGGGSSLTSTLSLISGQSVLGFNSTNGFTAPNNTSPYYVSGVGNGAPAISSNPRAGGNGRIVLVYMA